MLGACGGPTITEASGGFRIYLEESELVSWVWYFVCIESKEVFALGWPRYGRSENAP